MGRSKDPESLGIEDRQYVGVGFGGDVLEPVDFVRGMGGWNGESRHTVALELLHDAGRKSHGVSPSFFMLPLVCVDIPRASHTV